MDIENFRQIVSDKDFQRLPRFRTRVHVPRILLGEQSLQGQRYSDIGRYLDFMASSSDLPGSMLMTHHVLRYGYGVAEKKPVAAAFNDIMVTFYNDGNNDNLNLFQDWHNAIVNFNMATQGGILGTSRTTGASVYEVSYKDDYAVPIVIDLFDQSDAIVYSITLREAYPIAIPEIKLVAQPQPTVMQITVIFTYFDWFRTYTNPTQIDQPNPPAEPNPPAQPTQTSQQTQIV